MTADEYARKNWEREGWGEPRDENQRRYWTLFFTDHEPGETFQPQYWTRPRPWVEELIRA